MPGRDVGDEEKNLLMRETREIWCIESFENPSPTTSIPKLSNFE